MSDFKWNINPDPSKRSDKEILENFWAKDREGKYILDVENYEEEDVVGLCEEDWEQCRFKIKNMTQRLAECIVHSKKGFSHGLRLHPPHLFNLDAEGKLYKKVDGKWVRFIPKWGKRLDATNNR